jgi:hypothetical protein
MWLLKFLLQVLLILTKSLLSNEASNNRNFPKWVAKTIKVVGFNASNPSDPRTTTWKSNHDHMAMEMDAKDIVNFQQAKSYMFHLGTGPIIWSSKKHIATSLSSYDTKCRAIKEEGNPQNGC